MPMLVDCAVPSCIAAGRCQHMLGIPAPPPREEQPSPWARLRAWLARR